MVYLAIDPGSTSTKTAVYHDGSMIKGHVDHPRKKLETFTAIPDQKSMRYQTIDAWLEDNDLKGLPYQAVIARGGLIRPVPGGVYAVNEAMIKDLIRGVNGHHASNLGGLLAHDFANAFGCPAWIADPVVVDEMSDLAKLSGLSGLERKSIFHALNQKAMARRVSEKIGKPYDELNLIVAHLGGGISVGAHQKGRVVDVNDALSGDGPYAPERTGGLPVSGMAELIRSGKYTPETLVKTAGGNGGVVSYLGVSDMREVEKRIQERDAEAEKILNGMIYQIAKEIGSLAAVLSGRVDAVVITGGISHSTMITDRITDRVRFIAPVYVEPGEQELEALINAARRVIEQNEPVKSYPVSLK